MHENNAVLSRVNNEQILEPVLESNLCTCAMARRRLSDATRWQIIGMSNAGLSGREISRRLGYSQSSFVACSINFSKPITYRTEHAQGGPGRRHEGKIVRY